MPGDFEDLYDLEDMDDEEIASLILEELSEYPEVDPDGIDVEVEDGFVTLTGRVGTEFELQEIEHVISDVLGIANYSNELVVDELVRVEYNAGADDAVVEDEEVEAPYGEEGIRAEPSADHLLDDVEGQAYGTHHYPRALEVGETYEPPDRPIQEGSWSEENH
ncbi:MAG TPA: BON domain-containing protein [Longimicrobiales bacterium]